MDSGGGGGDNDGGDDDGARVAVSIFRWKTTMVDENIEDLFIIV